MRQLQLCLPLDEFIRRNFPTEYENRLKQDFSDEQAAPEYQVPIFVCSLALPGG